MKLSYGGRERGTATDVLSEVPRVAGGEGALGGEAHPEARGLDGGRGEDPRGHPADNDVPPGHHRRMHPLLPDIEEALPDRGEGTISYGVQDLVYTRVFCMIIVRDVGDTRNPFECHGFVCESRTSARRLTYCLATAFAEYSARVRGSGGHGTRVWDPPKFAVDLRTPEELRADIRADSEA
ncbi:unnamed protein product [Nezara viridula]|uniref:PID domain-containing protein n=1 Tax=Nezara viridula TaxID=85310 RepID=A0A9P0HJW7_NEZVI|nr:unnamed protein product [Nezara viridula]